MSTLKPTSAVLWMGQEQIDSYGVLATIKGSSFCRNGIFYYVDDQGIVAYDTTNNSESRILDRHPCTFFCRMMSAVSH